MLKKAPSIGRSVQIVLSYNSSRIDRNLSCVPQAQPLLLRTVFSATPMRFPGGLFEIVSVYTSWTKQSENLQTFLLLFVKFGNRLNRCVWSNVYVMLNKVHKRSRTASSSV